MLIFGAAIIGCAPSSRNVSRESGQKQGKQQVPAVSFEEDQRGNVVVDLDRADALADNSTAVIVPDTPLGRPIILTHLTGNIYYALDSKCGKDSCIAVATPSDIFCPCDSTHYDLSGAAVEGPGRRPLREIPSLLNGHKIRIRLR